MAAIATREWKPLARQEVFLTLPDAINEALYGGAAGGGKSDALMMLPLYRGFHQNPRYKGIILRRTFPELEQELIPRSAEWYSAAGARYNEAKKVWIFPSGARQHFGHAEHEKDITKYDSAQFNVISFDEATHFTEFQYRYMLSRNRSADSSLPAIMRSGTNPGNVGHAFFRDRFVEPFRNGMKIIKDKRTGLTRFFVPAFVDDNYHLMNANPQYAKLLQELPERDKRAKLYGDWYVYEGQVFDFRTEPLPDEPINARHVIEPFEIPDWWPRIAAIDWGYAANVWIGWFAIGPRGRVYLYREYCEKRKLISEWAAKFAELSLKEKIREVHLDPSAWQNRGQETIDQQFTKHSGYVPTKAINDRVGGKLLLQDMLRWTPRPRATGGEQFSEEEYQRIWFRLGRVAAYNYKEYFAREEEPYDLPRLQIFNTCTKVIDAIPKCIYDQNNPEDVAEFAGDDPYDGLRYGLQAVVRFGEVAKKEMSYFEERDRIANLPQTDMTSFYIEAARIEAGHRKKFGARLRRRGSWRRVG
jgi:hypothetical protein